LNDTTCPTSNPTIVPYTIPAQPTASSQWNAPTGSTGTYQITGYMDNYLTGNQSGGAINTSSALAIATGASTTTGCSGLQTPGGDGTYYAGAINAAETSLLAAQAANPNFSEHHDHFERRRREQHEDLRDLELD
jgi:hypothetical protein